MSFRSYDIFTFLYLLLLKYLKCSFSKLTWRTLWSFSHLAVKEAAICFSIDCVSWEILKSVRMDYWCQCVVCHAWWGYHINSFSCLTYGDCDRSCPILFYQHKESVLKLLNTASPGPSKPYAFLSTIVLENCRLRFGRRYKCDIVNIT